MKRLVLIFLVLGVTLTMQTQDVAIVWEKAEFSILLKLSAYAKITSVFKYTPMLLPCSKSTSSRLKKGTSQLYYLFKQTWSALGNYAQIEEKSE
ncbi:MAG: hypothetical protein LBM08_08085 [Dysgonamonadaceae bacterium]|jgi:hypothetical protein|nr:hypothetical protein [Dysgonamonadaceae bacterium]